MKKLFPFIALSLLLVGCSEPTIHKPSFSPYGKKLDVSDVVADANAAAEKYRNIYYEEPDYFTYSNFTKTVEIKNIISKSQKNDDSNHYYQMEEHTIIDCKNRRANISYLIKDAYVGNVDQDTKKREITKQEYYVEIDPPVDDTKKITMVDKTSGTYVEGLMDAGYSFARVIIVLFEHLIYGTSYTDLVLSNPITGHSPSEERFCSYYKNGKTFTKVYKSNERNYIIQVQYGKTIRYKGSSSLEDKTGVTNSYVDSTTKMIDNEIKQFNYSNFENITKEYVNNNT